MPKKAKDKVIEVDGDAVRRIGTIRQYKGDIDSFKSRIKAIDERIGEIIDGLDEGTAVEKLQEQLEAARADLKRRLEGNSEYVKLTEDIADERLSLRDAESIMSDYLLAYFVDTSERQIELGPGEANEVILKGKLGKAKDFQTNLFSKKPEEK